MASGVAERVSCASRRSGSLVCVEPSCTRRGWHRSVSKTTYRCLLIRYDTELHPLDVLWQHHEILGLARRTAFGRSIGQNRPVAFLELLFGVDCCLEPDPPELLGAQYLDALKHD